MTRQEEAMTRIAEEIRKERSMAIYEARQIVNLIKSTFDLLVAGEQSITEFCADMKEIEENERIGLLESKEIFNLVKILEQEQEDLNECLFCGELTENSHFCNSQCHAAYDSRKSLLPCSICGKDTEYCFCSDRCMGLSDKAIEITGIEKNQAPVSFHKENTYDLMNLKSVSSISGLSGAILYSLYDFISHHTGSFFSSSFHYAMRAIKFALEEKGGTVLEEEVVLPGLNLQMFASSPVSCLVLSPEELKERKEKRDKDKAFKQVVNMCREMNWNIDEHGGMLTGPKGGTSARGEYFDVEVLDAVPYRSSWRKPFFNTSKDHLPLAFVLLRRKRVYAVSSKWFPHYSSSYYIVGQNETGTYFAHAVSSRLLPSDKRRSSPTLLDALLWVWNCPLDLLIRRQGDIAVIKQGGRSHVLPPGHVLQGDSIVHETHPAIQAPMKGERVIVGRRAVPSVNGQTRD